MADVITRFKVETDQFDRKVNQAKRSLDQFGMKGSDAGKNIDGLTRVLNINVGSLSKLSVGLAAAGAAMKVATDAFKKNEEAMDEWGRITESGKSIYEGFLNALNNGNISGYLSNINNIVSAARNAYDALDDLGTFNAFNQVNMMKARTEFTEAISGYREGSMSIDDVRKAADKLKGELSQRQSFEGNAYFASITKKAAEMGVSEDLLRQALTGSYGSFEALKNLGLSGTRGYFTAGGMFGGSNYVEEKVAANEHERLGQMLRKLSDDELQALQQLGATAQSTAYEIAQVDKQLTKLTSSANKSGGSAWKNPYKWMNSLTSTASFNTKPVDGSKILDANLPAVGEGIDRMTAGTRYAAKEAYVLAGAWRSAADCISLAGSALQGIDNKGVRVAGILAEAIANIALGFGAASARQGAEGNMWEWVAASISGAATMISTIAAVKQATAGYAQGGIVGSLNGSLNSPSGDNIVARLNAGEGVLTRAGIANVNSLVNGGFGQMRIEKVITGSELRLILTNDNRAHGGSRSAYAIR